MGKINIAELLKDCPKGMELDCTAFNNVKFQCADNDGIWIEYIDSDNHDRVIYLTYDGGIKIKNIETKCVIFPKGKTTWEGFHRPFKNGDVLFVDCSDNEDKSYQYIFILNKPKLYGKWHSYCHLDGVGYFHSKETYLTDDEYHPRFATEEEKAQLFDAIKANGYKWNEETKTLEKLPNFKVGDRIRQKGKHSTYTISDIKDSHYFCGNCLICDTCDTDWELVPNKFDITSLKPFDKVLVRNHEKNEWQPNFFNKYCKEINSFKLIGVCTPSYTNSQHFVNYCIPYEGNEHLLGTTNDCAEYFKTWK